MEAFFIVACLLIASFCWGAGQDNVHPRGSGKSNSLGIMLLILCIVFGLPFGIRLAELFGTGW